MRRLPSTTSRTFSLRDCKSATNGKQRSAPQDSPSLRFARVGRFQGIQSFLVLVRPDETESVLFRDFSTHPVFYLFVDHQALSQLLTDALLALRTVVDPSLHHTRSHGAVLVEMRIFGHAPITTNRGRRQPQPKVPVPAIAQDLSIPRIAGGVRSIRQAKVATIATSGQDRLHFFRPFGFR